MKSLILKFVIDMAGEIPDICIVQTAVRGLHVYGLMPKANERLVIMPDTG